MMKMSVVVATLLLLVTSVVSSDQSARLYNSKCKNYKRSIIYLDTDTGKNLTTPVFSPNCKATWSVELYTRNEVAEYNIKVVVNVTSLPCSSGKIRVGDRKFCRSNKTRSGLHSVTILEDLAEISYKTYRTACVGPECGSVGAEIMVSPEYVCG